MRGSMVSVGEGALVELRGKRTHTDVHVETAARVVAARGFEGMVELDEG